MNPYFNENFLSSTVNMVGEWKISNVDITYFFAQMMSQKVGKIGENCCFDDCSIFWDLLTCWLQKDLKNWMLFEHNTKTFKRLNLHSDYTSTILKLIFCSKCSKFNVDYKNAIKILKIYLVLKGQCKVDWSFLCSQQVKVALLGQRFLLMKNLPESSFKLLSVCIVKFFDFLNIYYKGFFHNIQNEGWQFVDQNCIIFFWKMDYFRSNDDASSKLIFLKIMYY